MRTPHFAFQALFLTVLLDMFGVGLIIPVLTPLFLTSSIFFDAEVSNAVRAQLFGVAMGLYPLAQFFCAPVLGALADRFGRRPVLLLSVLGTSASLFLFAFAIATGQLWLVLVARVLDGATGGNISVAYAALADMSTPETKPKNFGLIGAAFGLGFIVGPAVGGWVSAYGVAAPFLLAGCLSLINAVWIYYGLPETLAVAHRRRVPLSLMNGLRNVRRAFVAQHVWMVFAALFLWVSGFSFFVSFNQAFLIAKFGWSAQQIGTFFAYIGVWIIVAQAVVVPRVAGKFSPRPLMFTALSVLAVAIFMTTLTPSAHWQWLIVPFVSLSNGTLGPFFGSTISNGASASEQGERMGLMSSVQAAAGVWPSMVAGFLLAISPALPTRVGALLILCAVPLLWRYRPAV
jgi:DHA1 family tetracycline resistance protein-like MFS transporter